MDHFRQLFRFHSFRIQKDLLKPKFYIQGKPSKIGGKMGFINLFFEGFSNNLNKARKCM